MWSVSGTLGSPPQPMHIAFAIAALGAGGAERVLSLITASWVADHRITVISFDSADDAIFHQFHPRTELVRLDIPMIGRGRLGAIFATLTRVYRLRRTLGSLDPDAVISFLTKINVLTLIASLGTCRRVIISERNNPRMQAANSIWNGMLALLHWRAAAIVMPTNDSLAFLGHRARRRACVIGNPIELPAPLTPRKGSPVLAAVGRLTAQKGFDLLIAAFAAIAARHPDWTLRIWGEGELRGDLERQVHALGLADRIALPGNSNGREEWVRGADAFVCSSRHEGFGNALAEAAAAGLGVVSFDCPFGPSDIIRHERTGLLVPVGDTGALAAALDRLLGDSRLRERLGEAARKDMTRFGVDGIVAQWDALLARTVPAAARVRPLRQSR